MARKKKWWIIASVVGGLVLVAVILLVGGYGFWAFRRGGVVPYETVEADTSRIAAPTGGIETITWTNDQSRLTGDKAENFIAFSFEYPASWTVVENGTQTDSPNFVKVEKMTEDQFTIENFAVGWYKGFGAPQVLGMLEPQFSQSFPNYEKVSDETTTFAGIQSSGFRFQAQADTPKGPLTFWGRTLAVPVEPTRGIVVIMFASQLAPGVDRAEDVGEAGELPVILRSFRVGG